MISCNRAASLMGLFVVLGAPAMAQEDDPWGEVEEEVEDTLEESGDPEEESLEDPIGEVLEETRESSEYNRQLLSLEEDVNSLKERVFRSKATLQLLREIVIQGRSTGSRAGVWHVNRLGAAYTLRSISYYLNGDSVLSRTGESGQLDTDNELKVWEGALPPGNHNLTVSAVLQGNGFGVFSYVENYTFNVKSSYAFTAEDNHLTSIRVVLDEKRGFGRSFVDRPEVVYEVQSTRLVDE